MRIAGYMGVTIRLFLIAKESVHIAARRPSLLFIKSRLAFNSRASKIDSVSHSPSDHTTNLAPISHDTH